MRTEYKKWEWSVMRVLTGALLLITFRYNILPKEILNFSGSPYPIGLANILDLSVLSIPWVYHGLSLILLICLGWYIIHYNMLVAISGILIIGVLGNTYYDSQGSIDYVTNIVYLVLIGQWLAYFIHFLNKYSKKRDETLRVHSLAIRYSQVMIASFYCLAGISKLKVSGLNWVLESPNYFLQIYKSRYFFYYTYLEPSYIKQLAFFKTAFQDYRSIVLVGMAFVLLIECTAFIAVINRKTALFYGCWLFGFHQSVFFLMGFHFQPLEQYLVFYYINLPFWIVVLKNRIKRRAMS